MSILTSNAKKKREGYRLVGATIPLQADTYLTLYCLAKRTQKAKIISELLHDFIESHVNEKVLMNEIIQIAEEKWRLDRASSKGITFKQFKETLSKELASKHIPQRYIDKIINGLTQ